MSDNKENATKIARFLRVLAETIEENPDLVNDIDIKEIPVLRVKKKTIPMVDFDIATVYSEGGEIALRQKLEQLEIGELRAIIRRHGYDSAKLAEKWKNKDRLLNLIIGRVSARTEKGQVFIRYS